MDQYKLGDMEGRFADLLWQSAPIGTKAVTELCAVKFDWKRTTTYTMLKRLCERGLFENRGGMVVVLVTKSEFGAAQGEKFISEAFDGSLPLFLAAFTRRKKLSEGEIDELQRLIDEHKEVPSV